MSLECEYCNRKFKSGKSKASHTKWCKKGPHRSNSIKQSENAINAMKKISIGSYKCSFCDKVYDTNQARNGHLISCINNPNKLDRSGQRLGYKHSDKTRKKISDGRLKVIQNNPDTIYHHYGPSKPELYLINRFKNLGINLIDQYHDKRWKRGFKIDLYFPDKLIGIEVNGAFKYTKNGLKKYYVNRSKLILETSGIKIIDLYYTKVYTLTDEELLSLIS